MSSYIKKHSVEILIIITLLVLVLCIFLAWNTLSVNNRLTNLESTLESSINNNHNEISSYDIDEIQRSTSDTKEKVDSIYETINDIDFELRY